MVMKPKSIEDMCAKLNCQNRLELKMLFSLSRADPRQRMHENYTRMIHDAKQLRGITGSVSYHSFSDVVSVFVMSGM